MKNQPELGKQPERNKQPEQQEGAIKHSGPNHQGSNSSSPYPVSRLAPNFELVDLARQISEADSKINIRVNAKLKVIADQIKHLQAEAQPRASWKPPNGTRNCTRPTAISPVSPAEFTIYTKNPMVLAIFPCSPHRTGANNARMNL